MGDREGEGNREGGVKVLSDLVIVINNILLRKN